MVRSSGSIAGDKANPEMKAIEQTIHRAVSTSESYAYS